MSEEFELEIESCRSPETEQERLDRQGIYGEIKRELIKRGIPAEEIAFIHDFDTPAKKARAFADANAGKIREVMAMLDTQTQRLKDGEVRVEVDERLREQLIQALLGLTESDIENVLAKAIIRGSGLTAEALPVILDEKKSVIKGTGALTYTHPEPTDHLGGYHNLRRILTEAAATFTPAARAYGVEPMKGLLMVGLPGCGKGLTKKIASSVLGKSLLDLDFGSVMGEGGGVIGSSAMTIKRSLSIATTLSGTTHRSIEGSVVKIKIRY